MKLTTQTVNLILAALLLVSLLVTAYAINQVRSLSSEARGKPVRTVGTVSVSPNPVPLGSTSITISGSGYKANQYLKIDPTTLPGIPVTTDSTGAFSVNYTPWDGGYYRTGTYKVDVYDSKLRLLSSTTFVVQ